MPFRGEGYGSGFGLWVQGVGSKILLRLGVVG